MMEYMAVEVDARLAQGQPATANDHAILGMTELNELAREGWVVRHIHDCGGSHGRDLYLLERRRVEDFDPPPPHRGEPAYQW